MKWLKKQMADPPFGMKIAIDGLKRRGYSPSVVYDIGAAVGSWTRMALNVWPKASFVCFEPLEERRPELERLKAEHPDRVTLQLSGVSDSDGELSMGVSESLWDSSFAYGGKSSRKIAVRSLDSLVAEGLPTPRFIKIDVQGFERHVIDGATKTLKSVDLIVMECQFMPFCKDMYTLDDTFAYMSSRGFMPYEFVDFLRRPLDGAMGQCDVMFVKKSHPLVADTRWV